MRGAGTGYASLSDRAWYGILVSGDTLCPSLVRPGVQFPARPCWQTTHGQHLVSTLYTDNAVVESFFETLKRELVDGCVYRSHEEARQAIFEYVEVYYNRKRRHSSLGYLTPWEAECQATAA